MKIVKFSDAQTVKNSHTSKLLEYSIDLNDKDIDFCINTISGQYPEKGYCTNERCKEICYILEGKGTLNKRDESINFEKGVYFNRKRRNLLLEWKLRNNYDMHSCLV